MHPSLRYMDVGDSFYLDEWKVRLQNRKETPYETEGTKESEGTTALYRVPLQNPSVVPVGSR